MILNTIMKTERLKLLPDNDNAAALASTVLASTSCGYDDPGNANDRVTGLVESWEFTNGGPWSLVLLRGSGDHRCTEKDIYIQERTCIRNAFPRQRHDVRRGYVTEKICTEVAVPRQQHGVRRGWEMNKSLFCTIIMGNQHLLFTGKKGGEHKQQMIY